MHRSILIAGIAIIAMAACTTPTKVSASAQAPLTVEQQIQRARARIDQTIEFHSGRVKSDPEGAIGLAMLAEAYLEKSRSFDDDLAALKAEESARKSLEVRRKNNSRAANLITKSMLAQHKFSEAFESASVARQIDPKEFASIRLYAEVCLELGKYAEFKKSLTQLNDNLDDPASLSVLSRWSEISGNPEQAIGFAEAALEKVEGLRKSSPAVVASFETALGTTLLKAGDCTKATEHFESAYALNPVDYRAAAGLARTAARLNQPNEVLKWGERCLALANLTDVKGLVALAYNSLNDSSKAEQLFKELDQENEIDPSTFAVHSHDGEAHSLGPIEARHTHNRLYASVMADAGRNVRIAHHVAEGDLQSRQDIYAYDCFAWATFRYWELASAEENPEGDFLLKEAKAAMERALATGCKDVVLLEHAARIGAAKPKY